MKKIVKSITLSVPGSGCNLQCSYCYAWRTSRMQRSNITFKYPVETMIKAFSKERIGGYAEVVVVGSAETLVRDEVIEVIQGLLQEGHVVVVVTNATLSKQVDKLLDVENKEILKNLIFKASLHYLELKKKNLLNIYFNNIKKVLASGASAYPFLVVSDEYAPYLNEIAKVCEENLGNTPHCSPCINYSAGYDLDSIVEVQFIEKEEKIREAKTLFESKIFEECLRFADINVQNKYCYAGKWSYKVDMSTGIVSRCHGLITSLNFFENVKEIFEMDDAVACSCGIATCALQYNFFSLGLIPEAPCKYLYGDLIYKKGFITEYIRERLNVDLKDVYGEDDVEKKYSTMLMKKNEQLEIGLNIINWMSKSLGESEVDYNKFMGNPFVNRQIYNAIKQGCSIGVYGIGGLYQTCKWAINYEISFFVKSDAQENEMFEGLMIYRPEQLSSLHKKIFLIIASGNKKEIIETLEKNGFVKGVDFI